MEWITWTPKARYIYFVQREDSGAIKIGMSERPIRRFRELQRQYKHARLHLLGVLPPEHRFDNDIHQKFQHLRLQGEWFINTLELMNFIRTDTGFDISHLDIEGYKKVVQKYHQ